VSMMHYICLLHMMRSLHIAICNNNYIAIYPHSILQEFAIDDEVMITIHFERFPPGIVRKLYARHTGSYRVLGRIASIIHKLEIP